MTIPIRNALRLTCVCAIAVGVSPTSDSCATVEEGLRALAAGYSGMMLPKLQEAVRLFREEAGRGGADGSVHYHLARTFEALAIYYTNQNDPAEARRNLEEGIREAKVALGRTPSASNYHTVLGNLYGELAGQSGVIGKIRNGRLATTSYARALELDPRNALAHVGVGIGKLETPAAFGGSPAAALGEFRIAQKLDPSCDEAWTWEGIALRRQGSIVEARHAFTKALEVNPTSDHARRELSALQEDF